MARGTIFLTVVLAVGYFWLFHRVLDRMRLTDKQALLIVGAMIAGSFVDLPLYRGIITLTLNMGAMVPVGVAIFVLAKAATHEERLRGAVGTLATAAGVYLIALWFSRLAEPGLDSLFVNGILAGAIAYLTGRSRRAAFIAGTLGVFLIEVVQVIRTVVVRMPTPMRVGGAGGLDAIVVSGLVAVIFAELVGELHERIRRE